VHITLRNGDFSYAEIPLYYSVVLGVTGTFETLSAPERKVLEKYNISSHTIVPSVYGKQQLDFAKANTTYDAPPCNQREPAPATSQRVCSIVR